VRDIATKKKTIKVVQQKECLSCPPEEALKKNADFYISKNPRHSDGRVPWCKKCIITFSTTENGEIDEEKFKSVLRQLDKPYYVDLIRSAINQFRKENNNIPDDNIRFYGEKIIGNYFKNINLKQAANKNYDDSEKDGFIRKITKNTNDVKREIRQAIYFNDSQKEETNTDDFEVTDEMIQLFGDGYNKAEYKKMNDKYETLKPNYPLQTTLHKESLATYVRFKIREEMATAEGNVVDAEKWYKAAQRAAMDGMLTPKQLSQEDLQSGITSISELVKTLEQSVDVIKILPQFKYRPNDAVDFTIYCYVDYERKLNGQPPVDYSEIYSFYDAKKEEYIRQNGDPYGIFSDDPTPKNRKNVEKFLELPEDYEDMTGGDSDG
jgi:hypothetical protein